MRSFLTSAPGLLAAVALLLPQTGQSEEKKKPFAMAKKVSPAIKGVFGQRLVSNPAKDSPEKKGKIFTKAASPVPAASPAPKKKTTTLVDWAKKDPKAKKTTEKKAFIEAAPPVAAVDLKELDTLVNKKPEKPPTTEEFLEVPPAL